jgi:hypothetical protein
MQSQELGIIDILGAMFEVIRENAVMVVLSCAGVIALFTLFDMGSARNANLFPSVAVSVFGQYHFVEAAMPEYRARSSDHKRRYGSLFAAGIIGGLGIVVGSLLLIIPGLYLAARWAIATPFIVVDGQASTQSLKSSWHATERFAWPIVLAVVVWTLPVIALLVGIAVIGAALGFADNAIVDSLLGNSLATVWLVGGWCMGIAIFKRVNPLSGAYDDVFA